MLKKFLFVEFLLLALLFGANIACADEIFIRDEVLPKKYRAVKDDCKQNELFVKIPENKNPHPIKPQIFCLNCGQLPCVCGQAAPITTPDAIPCPAKNSEE